MEKPLNNRTNEKYREFYTDRLYKVFHALGLKINASSLLSDRGFLSRHELEQLLDTYGDHISDTQFSSFFYGKQKDSNGITSLDERCFYQSRQNIPEEFKRTHAIWNVVPWNGEEYTTIDTLGFQVRADGGARPYHPKDENGLFVIDLARILNLKMAVENPAIIIDSITQEYKLITLVYDMERIIISRLYCEPFILARKK